MTRCCGHISRKGYLGYIGTGLRGGQLSIDIEEFSLTQTLAARLFEGIQPLYSCKIVLTWPILRKNRLRHPEMDDKYQEQHSCPAGPPIPCNPLDQYRDMPSNAQDLPNSALSIR